MDRQLNIFFDLRDTLPPEALQRLRGHRLTQSLRRTPRIFADTSNFTAIDYGDIILVDKRYFFVTGYTREGRFGVEEQHKPWVPRTEDLVTGEEKILKLVFHETFDVSYGPYTIPCYRNPEKEAQVLELVKGHPHFMQGYATLDEAGNLVRILDIVNGSRLDKVIHRGAEDHEQYFFEQLPTILRRFSPCLQAIGLLHRHGFRHGDIRRDHVLVDRQDGSYRWIDFDYDFYLPERPFALDLSELGNILIHLCARGDFHPREVLEHPRMGQQVFDTLCQDDISILSRNRIVNLRKLFPYMPEQLNNVLLHFSQGSRVFYDSVEELHGDLSAALESLPLPA